MRCGIDFQHYSMSHGSCSRWHLDNGTPPSDPKGTIGVLHGEERLSPGLLFRRDAVILKYAAMRTFLYTVIVLLAIGAIVPSLHAFEKEPTGFRDITWGAMIEGDRAYQAIGEEEADLAIAIQQLALMANAYVKPSETLDIGRARIERIIYYAFDGALVEVEVWGKGLKSFTALRDEFFSRHGNPGAKAMPETSSPVEGPLCIEAYEWHGKTTTIALSYEYCEGEGGSAMPDVRLRITDTRTRKFIAELKRMLDEDALVEKPDPNDC